MTTWVPGAAARPDAVLASASDRCHSTRLAWAVLLLVLAVGLPLFACMPPWFDVIH